MKSLVKIIFTSGLLFGVIHNTFAQSSFDGAFSQIGVGYANVSPSISTTPISITPLGSFKSSVNPSSQGSATGTISVGYYSSLSSNFLVGLGADYSPFSLSSGAVSGSATLPRGTLSGSGTYTVNNSYSLYLSPAYAVHKDGLIYAKVGYTGMSVTSNGPRASNSQGYTGYLLGLGYKQYISGGLYGFGEASYMSYGNQTATKNGSVPGLPYQYSFSGTSSFNTYSFLVGLGYRF